MSNIRRILTGIIFILAGIAAQARQAAYVNCQQGGQNVVTVGLNSTNFVMQSYPGCQIDVFLHSSIVHATIFSDNSSTPLSNPFTASLTDGHGVFYADNGHYDIQLSGAGISSPFTLSDVLLNDPGISINCSQMPALLGDATSIAGTCVVTFPNIATAGSGQTVTINAKGQVTAVNTAASTDLSDSAFIARLSGNANFGVNTVTAANVNCTTSCAGAIANFPVYQVAGVPQNGTGALVGTTSPALVTPSLGVATATSVAVGGGTALTTTNATGSGNLVKATAPSVSSPTITGTASGSSTLPTNMLQSATALIQSSCTGTATANTTLGLTMTACTSSAGMKIPLGSAGTISTLECAANTAGVNTSSGNVAILKNGVAQTLTCTMGTSLICSDLTHSFSVVAGDNLVFIFTTQIGETLAGLSCTVDKH